MRGQWLGRYSGTNSGEVILEIDEFEDHYEGRAFLFDDNLSLPWLSAWIKTANLEKEFALTCPIIPVHPHTGDLVDWSQISNLYAQGITVPTSAETSWKFESNEVTVTWTTNIGTSGSATLQRSNANRPSDLEPLPIKNWDEFRRHFRDHKPYRFIYRGQSSNKWRLQTSFHRTKRSDIYRYLNTDVALLHQNLSSLTSHYFNLSDPKENGAFMNLIQHHGYPTPLLDWTFSPFIAAYFAYRRAKVPKLGLWANTDKVRIFMFDSEAWRSSWNQLARVHPARPHFSLFLPVALNNTRMVPQQGISSFTNMEDVEEYIRTKEKPDNPFLQAVDLPVVERVEVLTELATMGITPGSLFPGLDGACEQMKERLFGYD